MSKCVGCGEPVEGDYELRLVERFKGADVWTYSFCDWRCLVEFLIDRGKVKAEVKPCA